MLMKKLSKSVAAVAAASMMLGSSMMAFAAPSEKVEVPTAEELEELGLVTVERNEEGVLIGLTIDGSNEDSVLTIEEGGEAKALVMKGGVWDPTFSSYDEATNTITPFVVEGADGYKAEYMVAGGTIITSGNGATICADGKCYFLVDGRIAREAAKSLVEYNGAWFACENGMIDTEFSGEFDYVDGEGNAVKALIVSGRLATEADGLVVGFAGKNYFANNGVVMTNLTSDSVIYGENIFEVVEGEIISVK